MRLVTCHVPYVPNDQASFPFLSSQFRTGGLGSVEKVTFMNHPRISSHSCAADVTFWTDQAFEDGKDRRLWLRDTVTMEKTGRYLTVRLQQQAPTTQSQQRVLSRTVTLRSGLCYLE